MPASGPEGKYIARIHRQLDKNAHPDQYHMSNTNPYVGGIPDQYYEGPTGVLWIEYKFLKVLPPILDMTNPKKKLLTQLQIRWLRRATKNHGNTAVILGLENGEGVWLRHLAWEKTHTKNSLITLEPAEIALKIRHVIA